MLANFRWMILAIFIGRERSMMNFFGKKHYRKQSEKVKFKKIFKNKPKNAKFFF